MTNPSSPKSLGSYLWNQQALTPAYSRKNFSRVPFVVKVYFITMREYWKKRDPVYYFKCLCSMLCTISNDVTDKIILPPDALIEAPDTMERVSQHFTDLTAELISEQSIVSMLHTNTTAMQASTWSGSSEVGIHVWAQARFMWAVITAIHDKDLQMDETIALNKAVIVRCIPAWMRYMESIINAYTRK